MIVVASSRRTKPEVAEAESLPDRCHCGATLTEDLTFRSDAQRLGVDRTRLVCLAGHSIYRGIPGPARCPRCRLPLLGVDHETCQRAELIAAGVCRGCGRPAKRVWCSTACSQRTIAQQQARRIS